jgi:GTP-dependent phosphoenolpyruvate carboxykinase
MLRAYEEIVDFIAAGTTPQSVASFEASQESKDDMADLIHREKTTGLTPDETSELDHFLRLEHLMRMAKARARSFCCDDELCDRESAPAGRGEGERCMRILPGS